MTSRDGADLALERERKFVMPEGVTLPPLERLGPTSPSRTLRLRAVYFDTPSRDLTGAGITLRRRTGGDDDGWHLKTPGPGGARLEHRLPIGAPHRVPASLRATVADVVGDRPLLPVLRLRTRRRAVAVFAESGRARLEVAIDEVESRLLEGRRRAADRWSEVEVELAAGEPDSTLDEASAILLAAGLVASHVASKAHRVLDPGSLRQGEELSTAAGAMLSAVRRQYGRFQALETAIASDEPDAVHKARVALRRMRSILSVFAPTIRAPDLPALHSELRWAGALLGAPRDTEVLRELIDRLGADTTHGEPGPDAAIRLLDAHLDSRHEAARAHLLAAMATPRWDALHERIVSFLLSARASRPGRRPALPELRRLARRADTRVARRRDQALSAAGDLTLWHAVRKAAKAARYAHEEVAGLPHSLKSDRVAAESFEEATTAFGAVQDLVLIGELIADVSPLTDGLGSQWAVLNATVRRLSAERLQDAQSTLQP